MDSLGINFSLLHYKNICCGPHLNRLSEMVPKSVHNMFSLSNKTNDLYRTNSMYWDR